MRVDLKKKSRISWQVEGDIADSTTLCMSRQRSELSSASLVSPRGLCVQRARKFNYSHARSYSPKQHTRYVLKAQIDQPYGMREGS